MRHFLPNQLQMIVKKSFGNFKGLKTKHKVGDFGHPPFFVNKHFIYEKELL